MIRTRVGMHVSVQLFFLLTWTALVYAQLPPKYATITPVDALAFVGETLKVECVLLPKAVNVTSSSDMYFEVYPNVSGNPIRIFQESQDNKTISGQFEITDNFQNYVIIYCRNSSQTLRSTGLYVERPIQNITNFAGVFYYDSRTISTNWSLSEIYLNPDDIRVDTDWNPWQPPDMGNSCNSSTDESCNIDYGGQGIIFFRINVSHARANKRPSTEYLDPLYQTYAVSVHRFVPSENMKTGPPTLLTVIEESTTCANVTWQDSQYFHNDKYSNTIYQLEIKAEDEANFMIDVYNAVKMRNSTEPVQLCGLEAYTRYFLNVRIRAHDNNPWSDPVSIEFKTMEDRPRTGPPLMNTSYYAGECVAKKRDVFVYWKDPSKSSLRGQLTMYEIVMKNKTMLLRAGNNYYKDSLDCDGEYEIFVYSATKIGLSEEPSIIVIPEESNEIKVENDLMFRVEDRSVVTGSSMNVSITWDPEDLDEFTILTVFMCQETYPNTCFNDFTTREIAVDQKNLVINDLPVTTNLFGYALSDNNGHKRGIKWTNCVYRADLKPDPPTGLQVSPGSVSRSLLISWNSAQCSKTTKVLVLSYHLYICSQAVDTVSLKCEHCNNVSISNVSIHNYFAKDLQGGHSYYVYIQAESPAGLGHLSKPVVGVPKTPDSDSDLETVLGISFGSISFIFLVGTAIFCLARCCRNAKKRVIVYKCPNLFTLLSGSSSLEFLHVDIGTISTQNSVPEQPVVPVPTDCSVPTNCPVPTDCPVPVQSDTDDYQEIPSTVNIQISEDISPSESSGDSRRTSLYQTFKSLEPEYMQLGVPKTTDQSYFGSQEVLLPTNISRNDSSLSFERVDDNVRLTKQQSQVFNLPVGSTFPNNLITCNSLTAVSLTVARVDEPQRSQDLQTQNVPVDSHSQLEFEGVFEEQMTVEVNDSDENNYNSSEHGRTSPGYVTLNSMQGGSDDPCEC